MITEVITYIRQQCVTAGVTTAYQDLIPSSIPSNELLNVCAIRALPGSNTTNNLNCDANYSDQLFSILYRGYESDRLASLNVIDAVADALNDDTDITLTNTIISTIQGQKPAFAYEDENGIIHYNMDVFVIYNKK